MKILHLASQYTVSPVYKELITHLKNIPNTDQYVFVGTRKDSVVDRYLFTNSENMILNIKYTHGKISRALFYPRILKVLKKLEISTDLREFNIVHAHTLFSDGGTALLIKKKYNIDYVVTVRASDIVGYLKKVPHARVILNEIILNAKKIIFISPNMKNILSNYINKKAKKKLETNSINISNGISDYWHNNLGKKRSNDFGENIKFLQISELIKRKNIDKSVFAVKKLNDLGIKAHLDVIGEGSYEDNFKKIIKNNNLEEYVDFIGTIKEKKEIRNYYLNHDVFIMPSKNETFGLVYAEAMSQGLPIIYTNDTGIYGYFAEGEIGYGVDPDNIDDIVEKTKKILDSYEVISKKCIENSRQFNWNNIAKKIYDVYNGD